MPRTNLELTRTQFHIVNVGSGILVSQCSSSSSNCWKVSTTTPSLDRGLVVVEATKREPTVPGPLQSGFSMKWLELEERAKQFERNPDDDAGYHLVKEMLDLALDAVQSAEVDECHHITKAQKQLKQAADLERDLELAAQEIHVEASDADAILETYQSNIPFEDRNDEYHRELAASDIAHRVENYVESRLEAARKAEEAAKQDEMEARENLSQLLANEHEICTVLEELKIVREKWESSQP